jgi:hypothetical protein
MIGLTGPQSATPAERPRRDSSGAAQFDKGQQPVNGVPRDDIRPSPYECEPHGLNLGLPVISRR